MSVLIYEKKDKIAYITLNRPGTMNAINSEVLKELTKAWMDVRDDPDIWVTIVTGAGDRAFSAGADLKEIAKWQLESEMEGRPLRPGWSEICPMRGLEVWKPFIAAINGVATGGGLELAMACDLRIAADTARLGLMETKQSLMPGWGGTQRLPRLVPFGKALEILMTGDFIDAKEALRIGLVNQVVPTGELLNAATNLANRLCENGPLAVRAVKEAAYRGVRMTLDEGLKLESLMIQNLFQAEDVKEGPRAFAEKRKPVYKGR